MHPPGQQAGFTLTELLVVLLILGVVLGIAGLSPEPVEAQKIESASADIADALRFAGAEALRTTSNFGVQFGVDSRFNTSKDTVTVFYEKDGANQIASHPISGKPYQFAIEAPLLGAEIDFAANFDSRVTVVFDGSESRAGAPLISEPGTVTIISGQISRIITVDNVTGRVTSQ